MFSYDCNFLSEEELPSSKRLSFCSSENLAAAGLSQDLYYAGGNRVWDAVSGWLERKISLNSSHRRFNSISIQQALELHNRPPSGQRKRDQKVTNSLLKGIGKTTNLNNNSEIFCPRIRPLFNEKLISPFSHVKTSLHYTSYWLGWAIFDL